MWLFRLRNRMIGHSRVSWDPILTHTHRWYDFFREIWDDFEAPNWQYTVTWNEVNQTSPKWVPAVSCGFSRNFQGFPFYLLAFKIQITMHQRWKEMPKWCSICCCPHLWSTLTHIHLQDFSFWVKEWFMVHIHWMINHALFFTNEPEPFFLRGSLAGTGTEPRRCDGSATTKAFGEQAMDGMDGFWEIGQETWRS